MQIRHGETFEDLLRANGASKEAIPAILAAFGLKAGESPVAEGQKIILQYDAPPAPDKPAPIARISVYSDEQLKAEIAVNDQDAYVRMAVRRGDAARQARERRRTTKAA